MVRRRRKRKRRFGERGGNRTITMVGASRRGESKADTSFNGSSRRENQKIEREREEVKQRAEKREKRGKDMLREL